MPKTMGRTGRQETSRRAGTQSKAIRGLIVAFVVSASLLVTLAVLAQPGTSRPLASSSAAPSAAASASASATPSASAPVDAGLPPPVDPRVAELDVIEAQVRALAAGSLAADVDPKTLFPIDPSDAKAVRLQRARLTLLLAAVDEAARQPAIVVEPSDGGVRDADLRDATDATTADAATVDAPGPPEGPAWLPDEIPPKDVPIEVWRARLGVDRARLAFYDLTDDERARLLASHAAKSAPPAPSEAAAHRIDEAERRAQEAEEEQKRALEAAALARTEAQRAVAEEQARLLGVKKSQADLEARFARVKSELVARADKVIAWQRRIRDLRDAGMTTTDAVDRTYDELRAALRDGRERLTVALDTLGQPSEVPLAGPDRLLDLPDDVDSSAARATRVTVEEDAAKLQDAEETLRFEIAKNAYDEVVALNRERLMLFDLLSSEKRSAIAGFGAAGIDQARAEIWQVSLVVRYHLSATYRWVASIRAGEQRGQSALTATLLALRWLLPIALFIAWMRRAPRVMERARQLAKERSKSALGLSAAERAVEFAIKVRKPLERLVVAMTVLWLLPGDMRALWEIKIVETVVVWSLGGQLIVAVVDATFGDRGGLRASRLHTAHLRLRSFRLVGRIVVGVGLVLAITNHLVGKGTIYEWVSGTAWLVLIPVAFVLGVWWRPVVFERIELRRRKNVFDDWILKRKEGWRGVVASILGGSYLLGTSAFRKVRTWVTKFELSRRVLAYLFLRGMSKRAGTDGVEPLGPIPKDTYDALGPATVSPSYVSSVADGQLKEIIARIQDEGGGVFAVVGERGAGKTTTLKRVEDSLKDVIYLECDFDGEAGLKRALSEASGLSAGDGLAELARTLDEATRDGAREGALIIDDAHRLIQPRMGGLDEFDALLGIARRSSRHMAWVFAFDETLWRFFERARGARPLFDEVIYLSPWREEGIARLLITRSKTAKITPSFDRLLEGLPKDADETDLQEANERAATGYYRLLWDYADGNPGVALHMWRSSLGRSEDGETMVKLFSAPDEYELDALPDNAVFVLRAVLQLERAMPDDLERATMLPPARVADALRHGVTRGYLREEAGRYHITWAWYRPITRLLRRRHLLFSR